MFSGNEKLFLKIVLLFFCLSTFTIVYIIVNNRQLANLPNVKHTYIKSKDETKKIPNITRKVAIDYDSKYIIHAKSSQYCKVPHLNLNPPETESLLEIPEGRKCSEMMPNLFEMNENNELENMGHPKLSEWTDCCYRSFTRGKDDNAEPV